MRTNVMSRKLLLLPLIALITASLAIPALASEEHGSAVYHAFHLETGLGVAGDGANAGFADWDFDGWIGTDENKLWLKSEGERESGVTNQAEFWAMYSRNISMFWDAQIGIRHDTQPHSLTYAVIGFEGLAPYFFETEAHLLISEDGDVSARIRQENEFLFTQKLIAQLYVEANLYAQDVTEMGIGSGLSDAEFGIQTRYEIQRSFAPYIDVKYEREFGKTSSITQRNGGDNDAVIVTLGFKFLF